MDEERASLCVRILGEIEENSDCDKPVAEEELPLKEEVLDRSGINSGYRQCGGHCRDDAPGHVVREPAVAIQPHPQQHIRNKGLVEALVAPAALRVTQGVINIYIPV